MDSAEERDSTVSRLSYATSLVGHGLFGVVMFLLLRNPEELPQQRLIEVTIISSPASPLPPEQVLVRDEAEPMDAPRPVEQRLVYNRPVPQLTTPTDQPIVDAPEVSEVTSQEEGSKVAMFMEAISDSKPLYNPAPRYPDVARRKGYEGVVMLEVKISAWGTVDDAVVLRSSGYDMLDDAARNAVRDWRFEPAINNQGDYVSTRLRLPIVFKLD